MKLRELSCMPAANGGIIPATSQISRDFLFFSYDLKENNGPPGKYLENNKRNHYRYPGKYRTVWIPILYNILQRDKNRPEPCHRRRITFSSVIKYLVNFARRTRPFCFRHLCDVICVLPFTSKYQKLQTQHHIRTWSSFQNTKVLSFIYSYNNKSSVSFCSQSRYNYCWFHWATTVLQAYIRAFCFLFDTSSILLLWRTCWCACCSIRLYLCYDICVAFSHARRHTQAQRRVPPPQEVDVRPWHDISLRGDGWDHRFQPRWVTTTKERGNNTMRWYDFYLRNRYLEIAQSWLHVEIVLGGVTCLLGMKAGTHHWGQFSWRSRETGEVFEPEEVLCGLSFKYSVGVWIGSYVRGAHP